MWSRPIKLQGIEYEDQGFEVLAVPCNQFAGQELGINEEIEESACTTFKAEFPIFNKGRGEQQECSPTLQVFKILKWGIFGDGIKWNFTEYLVNREGKVVDRKISKICWDHQEQ
ncbi:hypothetical protein BT93_B1913 [Corymbia citriodora subsp. variegata]|nr:hypothetical protein BT93_B1913 [Corymbia citriodora subsp. variegata]KAF8039541.1 hypothetical protein BT93_B1913 [Corymbia citriodora subsp. variegata]